MIPFPRYCFCQPGQAPWPACIDDRYCGLCGQELLGVVPRGPVLAPGPPIVLAVYLRPAASFMPGNPLWTGRLALQLVGLIEEMPRTDWLAADEPALCFVECRLATATTLELSFQAKAPGRARSGPLGWGRLRLAFGGQTFDIAVQGYAVDGSRRRAWLRGKAGERAEGAVLMLLRGRGPTKTLLEFEEAPGVPAQWEDVRCDHPGVTVTLLHPERARSRARALVRWDPTLLAGDDAGEEVVFHLQPRALPAFTFRQRLCWRLRQPLRLRPAGVIVAALSEDRTESRLVEVTNVDRQPLILSRVEPQAPWLEMSLAGANLPLALAPGESTSFRLDLHPQRLNEEPPQQGEVALVLHGRGRQPYSVRVERLQPLRRLEGPLLLDPGPPRIVLARWDPGRGQVAYLPSSGDGGLDPEGLGLSRQEYAEAVQGRRPARPLLRYLVGAVLACCRMRDHLAVETVRLCRQPWVPAEPDVPGVEVCGWAELCRARLGKGPILRLEPWGCYQVEGSAGEAVALLEGAQGWRSFGAELLEWLARCLADFNGRSCDDMCMRLICDELLADLAWGTRYAWERLRTRLSLPPAACDPEELERELARWAADHAQQASMALLKSREAIAQVSVVGSLVRGPAPADVVRSVFTSAGFEAECVAPSWAEWLHEFRGDPS
jgi:hypothetical protein